MSDFLKFIVDGWMELATTALLSVCCLVAGVQYARKMSRRNGAQAQGQGAAKEDRITDLRSGVRLGAGVFGTSMVSGLVTEAILAVLAIGIIIALALVPTSQYLLVTVGAAPFVIGGIYLIYRSERWSLLKLFSVLPNKSRSGRA